MINVDIKHKKCYISDQTKRVTTDFARQVLLSP